MITPNEFWLSLHELAQAASAEGTTDEERRENIVASLEAMPSMARAQVLDELEEMVRFLPELQLQIASTDEKPLTVEGDRGVA